MGTRGDVRQGLGENAPGASRNPVALEPNPNRPLSSPSKGDALEKQRKSKETSETFTPAGQRPGRKGTSPAAFGDAVRSPVTKAATVPGHGPLHLRGSRVT